MSSGARLRSGGRWLALGLAVLASLLPLWWMMDTSLKRQVDIFGGISLVPPHPTAENYRRLFSEYHFGPYLFNSMVVVAAVVVVSMVLGTLAAYALARFDLAFGLSRHGLVAAVLVRMIPPILLVVPFYIVLSNLGLLDSRLGLILVYTGINTSFVIWIMQSFLADIPVDIEEAALVDGDSHWTAMRRVVLPLAAPGLAATAIFSVINVYNDFLIALTLTSTPASKTVPVGISGLIGKIQIAWGPMAAAGVVGALPILVFAVVVQRHFVRGLTMGALK